MKRKPILGETLFDLNIGNAARKPRVQELTPVIVKSVGRKCFTCGPPNESKWAETQYKIETWEEKSDYCANHKLYETQQQWEDEKESNEIYAEIRTKFNHYGKCDFSLDTLRAIKSLIQQP